MTIIWTKAYPILWHLYAALGGDGFKGSKGSNGFYSFEKTHQII